MTAETRSHPPSLSVDSGIQGAESELQAIMMISPLCFSNSKFTLKKDLFIQTFLVARLFGVPWVYVLYMQRLKITFLFSAFPESPTP